MRGVDATGLLAGALMAIAAGAAIALKPAPVPEDAAGFDLETIIPRAFGDWSVDARTAPVAPAPDVQAKLERLYSQLVSRTYVNARGERVMLVIAYGGEQSDALKAHRQEVCYAAQGFEIRGVRHGTLRVRGRTVPVTRVLAVRGARSEPVTYWFTMGDRVVLGRLERLLVQLRYGLLAGRVPDGILVRVSSIAAHPRRAFEEHAHFVDALLAGVPQHQLDRLLGAAAGGAAAPRA